jgi:magnesium transporter
MSPRALARRKVGPGGSPGSLVVDPGAPRPKLSVLAYGPDDFVQEKLAGPQDVRPFLEKWPVTWLNVDGLGDARVLTAIGEIFGLHRLALEDVLNLHQRPKVEEYGDLLFVVAQMVERGDHLHGEQLSLFLGRRFVLTFQEREGDAFDPIRERIRQGKGRIRHAGPDYLAYALLDAVVDGTFPLLEAYGEELERLEDEILLRASRSSIPRIHTVRRDLLWIRRAVWPLREAVASLAREGGALVSEETRVYLRDVHDHAVQVLDLVEVDRELVSGLMEVYLTSVSNHMNEVMKVLTVIATIFIPLTFVVGVYGMNFDRDASPWNMPELGWRFGYPACLLVMGALAGGLVLYFHRKGWIGGGGRPAETERASDASRSDP